MKIREIVYQIGRVYGAFIAQTIQDMRGDKSE